MHLNGAQERQALNAVTPRPDPLWSRVARHPLAFLVALVVLGILAVGIGSQFGNMRGQVPGSSLVQSHKSLLDMLRERSPGTRTVAELTKHRAAPVVAPHERALAKVQPPVAPKEFLQAILPPLPVVAEGAPLLASNIPPITIPQLTQSSGPPIVTPLVPGGGVPSVPNTPGPPGPPSPPPTPPVPEPGTWAMLLLGFTLLGWKVRHKRGSAALVA